MNSKLNEIELFKFNNPIFEIVEIENSKNVTINSNGGFQIDNEDGYVYFPPTNELTNINWGIRSLCYNLSDKPEEFYKYYQDYDIMTIYEFTLYRLLNNFRGVNVKRKRIRY